MCQERKIIYFKLAAAESEIAEVLLVNSLKSRVTISQSDRLTLPTNQSTVLHTFMLMCQYLLFEQFIVFLLKVLIFSLNL